MDINKQSALNLTLNQVDQLGYQLNQFGITNKVNRHNLIALLMFGEQRVRGELTRMELQVGLRKAQLRKLREQAEGTLDQVIERTPAPISEPLQRLKSHVAA